MREELGALLDERLRPGVGPGHAKDGREATEIPHHVHELGDGVHEIVVVRDAAAVAVCCRAGWMMGLRSGWMMAIAGA